MPPGTRAAEGGELLVAEGERDAAAKRPNPVAATPESVRDGQKLFAIYCTPCHGPAGKGDGPVTPQFIPPPDLTSPPIQGTDRRLLALLHRLRRRRHAGLRRGPLGRGALAHRELPPDPGQEMSATSAVRRHVRLARPLLVLLAVARGVAFVYGRPAGRGPRAWAHLPREPALLVGARRHRPGDRRHDPAHRGALVAERQADRAHHRRASCRSPSSSSWSSSPGRAVLYPWVTEPVPIKAAWLNVPFFVGPDRAGGRCCSTGSHLAFAGRSCARGPAGRRRAPTAAPPRPAGQRCSFLFVVVLSLWGFDLVMSLDPNWYSGLFGGYFVGEHALHRLRAPGRS